jgi:hypothetical protein
MIAARIAADATAVGDIEIAAINTSADITSNIVHVVG